MVEITTNECNAIKLLHSDGWSLGELSLTFDIGEHSMLELHIDGICGHDEFVSKEVREQYTIFDSKNITTLECNAMRLLDKAGWEPGELAMVFHLSSSSNTAVHRDEECQHADLLGGLDVIVAGSRSIKDRSIVRKAINDSPFNIDKIIHGGAKGVDNNASIWASTNDIEEVVMKPDYQNHKPREAPLIRNKEMAKKGDALIAIWDGESTGTQHMIQQAKKFGMGEMYKEKIEDVEVFYLANGDK